MKTNFDKKIPRRLLGCLMAFAMVFFSTSATAQCTDVTLNMYDSYGDGGGEVTIDGAAFTIVLLLLLIQYVSI